MNFDFISTIISAIVKLIDGRTPQIAINQCCSHQRVFIIITNNGKIPLRNIQVSCNTYHDISPTLQSQSIDRLEAGEERRLQIGILAQTLASITPPSIMLDITGEYSVGPLSRTYHRTMELTF